MLEEFYGKMNLWKRIRIIYSILRNGKIYFQSDFDWRSDWGDGEKSSFVGFWSTWYDGVNWVVWVGPFAISGQGM